MIKTLLCGRNKGKSVFAAMHADLTGRNRRGTRWFLPGKQGVSAGETGISRA